MKKIKICLFSFLVLFFSIQQAEAREESRVSPTANIRVFPSKTGDINTEFEFDASNSRNSNGSLGDLQYRWNLKDGEGFSNWENNSKATIKYLDSGDRNIWLEVRDKSGASDLTKVSISVVDPRDPVVIICGYPREGTVETVFELVARVATKTKDQKEDLQIRWDFENDGVWDTPFADNFSVYHVFHDTGTYNVAVEIKDRYDLQFRKIGLEEYEDKKYLRVISAQSPDASFAVNPVIGDYRAEFAFDASLSFDHQDHHDLSYRWDFENDGIWDTDFLTTDFIKTNYRTEGVKIIRLQVKDSDGNIDETYRQVVAENCANSPPRASFEIKIVYQRKTIKYKGKSIKSKWGTLDASFAFDAGKSSDLEDKRDLLYRWDFEDDGVWDTSFSEDSKAEHIYPREGEYTVRLQVEDRGRLQDSAIQKIRVVSNEKPVASFFVEPNRGTLSTKFIFDASNSYDAQSKSKDLEIRWDFEGDKVWDTKFSNKKISKYQFSSYGVYRPIMQVRDLNGAISESQQSMEVIKSNAPVARLRVNQTQGVFQTKFIFDAGESYDQESLAKDLRFKWDLNKISDNDITFDTDFTTKTTQIKSFDKVGIHTVRVEVKDPEGNIDLAEIDIEIVAEASDVDFLQKRQIMNGYPDGTFGLKNRVLRGEMAFMLLKALGRDPSAPTSYQPCPDVGMQEWYANPIALAKITGLMNGYPDGNCHPEWDINQAEAFYMVLNAFGVDFTCDTGNPNIDCDQWYGAVEYTALKEGVIDEVLHPGARFNPAKKMTRGEIASLLKLAIENYGS